MTITNDKMLRLQKNLSIIRKLAGWTAEDLGERIGVTRQTITNIEKSEMLSMTKTQYIAIRAVFEFEIEESKNEILAESLSVLVDAEDLSDDQSKRIEEAVNSINSSKSHRISNKLVLTVMAAMLATLGPIGGVALSQAAKKAATTVPKWLSDLLK